MEQINNMTLWEQRKKQVGEFWKKYRGSKEHRKVEYELNKKHNPNFDTWLALNNEDIVYSGKGPLSTFPASSEPEISRVSKSDFLNKHE